MIVREPWRTREDGVKLYQTIDVSVDENGEPLRDKNGNLVPSGFQIKQAETNRHCNYAIDVEFAPYHYRATTVPIVVRKRKVRNNG